MCVSDAYMPMAAAVTKAIEAAVRSWGGMPTHHIHHTQKR